MVTSVAALIFYQRKRFSKCSDYSAGLAHGKGKPCREGDVNGLATGPVSIYKGLQMRTGSRLNASYTLKENVGL